ncbi:MAG: tetratricopeptide repeat protein [Hyphomicrobiaceae bacterium]
MDSLSPLAAASIALILTFTPPPAFAEGSPVAEATSKAQTLLDARKLGEAEALARSVLDQARKAATTPEGQAELAGALNVLAYAVAAEGRAEEALKLMSEAVAALRKAGGEDARLAQALNDEGVLLNTLARYGDAVKSHEAALAIRDRLAPEGDGDVAQSLDNLAQSRKRLGDLEAAEPLIRRAADLRERVFGRESAELGDTLADLADLIAETGREGEAIPLAKRALEITEKALGPDNPEVARRHIKLATVEKRAGLLAEAEADFRIAVQIREKVFGAQSRQVAGALSNLAEVVLLAGRPADAKPLLERALALQIKQRGEGHPSVGETKSRLASALRDLGERAEAARLFKEALEIQERALGPDHPEVVETLAGAAELAAGEERYGDAFDLLKRASETVERREALGSSGSVEDGPVTRRNGEIFRRFAEVGFERAEREEADRVRLATEVFKAAQRAAHSRMGVALTQLGARVGLADEALAEKMRTRQDLAARWQAAELSLIAELAKGKTSEATKELAAEMARTEQETAAIDAELAKSFPAFADLMKPRPQSIAEAQAALGADEALVFYLVNRSNTLIWALTKERLVWANAEIGEAGIAERVSQLRTALDTQKGAPLDLQLAHELYTHLLGAEEVARSLKDKRQLLLVPTGVLTGLPFQVLVAEAPEDTTSAERFRKAHWLIRDHAISVLPTVSSLQLLKSSATASKADLPFLGFGDPEFRLPADAAGGETTRGVKGEGDAAGDAAGGGGDAEGSVGETESLARPAAAHDAEVTTGPVESFYRGRHPDLLALSRGLVQLPETAAEIGEIASVLGAGRDALIVGSKASEATVKSLSRTGEPAALPRDRVRHARPRRRRGRGTDAARGRAGAGADSAGRDQRG